MKYLIDNLGEVFPDWQARCEEMQPYAEQIWKHAHLPSEEQFPLLDWEEGEAWTREPIHRLRDVEEDDGAMVDRGRKRSSEMVNVVDLVSRKRSKSREEGGREEIVSGGGIRQ